MKALAIKSSLFSCLKTYNKKTFMSDLMAGIIVGIVALPLAIAFGIASGVTPEKGIITAIVAGLIISIFGGSKVQIGGPTGAFIVIIYGIIQKYGMEGLTIATLMAGLFLVLFGLLRLGTIIKYIPYPIVVGFTSGIAVTIFTTQIKDLFGLTLASNPSDFLEKWGVYFQSFDTIDPWCALIGVVSVVVIAITPKFSKKIPGSLIAIILMTVVALLLKQFAGVESIETIGDRFSISNELPAAQVPEMNWETIKSLVSPAITIAILGAIESLLSATVADGVISDHHDTNTELVAQGLANIASPLFGGIPATGAIARTMTNINNGGKTPIAGIIHAVVSAAHLPLPDASCQVHPYGLSCRCIGSRILRNERMEKFPGIDEESEERCYRAPDYLLPHHHLRPDRSHRGGSDYRLSALHEANERNHRRDGYYR